MYDSRAMSHLYSSTHYSRSRKGEEKIGGKGGGEMGLTSKSKVGERGEDLDTEKKNKIEKSVSGVI
jgi:hypothetical protein